MRKVVGIDRKIKRAWLDRVLDRLVTTTDEADLRAFLDRSLREELPGKESRAKSVGIVLRIWSGVPKERLPLRDRALALLAKISGQERIWLHWGMTALAYPFFRDTAEVAGRLLALQDDFTTAQVQARLLTAWGDRATSKVAAQKLLTTLVDWEVLRATKTKGQFLLARKMTTAVSELQLWLLEALVGANAADEIEAQQLLRLPESFPFTLSVGVADLRKHEGFNIHRQGLDMDMVALRKVRVEQTKKPDKKSKKKARAAIEPQSGLFEQPEEVGARNGQPHAPDEIPVPAPVPETDRGGISGRRDEHRRAEAPEPATERPAQSLQVREMVLAPDSPFAATSEECGRQFRAGQFYACIALTQTVLEGLLQHVWRVKLRKKKSQEGQFGTVLTALHTQGLVRTEWKTRLDQMWANRHEFHELRPSVVADHRKLEGIARDNLDLLRGLENEVFGHTVHEGAIVPNHPDFWRVREGEPQPL